MLTIKLWGVDVGDAASSETFPSKSPVVIDIGGEGRHREAWNINPRRFKTCGPERGQPIPRLIMARAQSIPLPDNCADEIIMERTPLSRCALDEIRRIAKPGAIVVLRHAQPFGIDPHRVAAEVLDGKSRRRMCKIGVRSYQETRIKLSAPAIQTSGEVPRRSGR